MVKLSKVQHKVYRYFCKCWREHGGQPGLSQVAKDLGMHYVTFKQHLDALHRKGYLVLKPQGRGKPPVVRLPNRGVPLVGDIAAGGLVTVEEKLEGYLDIPGDPERFALRVRGDSMEEEIKDKDVVVFVKREPRSGEICAVRHNSEVTLKHFEFRRDGSALLVPHNPSYDPIEVRREEVVVEGVYESLLRGPIIGEVFIELAL
jgi:repressor LexA